jgi:hypothetical protein
MRDVSGAIRGLPTAERIIKVVPSGVKKHRGLWTIAAPHRGAAAGWLEKTSRGRVPAVTRELVPPQDLYTLFGKKCSS